MRSIVFFIGLIVCVTATKYELLDYIPKADPKAVVLTSDGHARFTVLTPSLIRMELSSRGKFEDRPTLAVVNRRLSVPNFTAQEGGGYLTITTSSVVLTYALDGAFDATSLHVQPVDPSSSFKGWNGDQRSETDTGNLMGTYRTLDGQNNNNLNCTLNQLPHCTFAFISRSGWGLVDDSDTPVLDDDDWWTDADGNLYPRAGDHDWYLFAHGLDYKQALYDYTLIGGKMPLTPRYISGIWYTRWYNYNSLDTRKEVEDFESRRLPLDVWVYDMNWHSKHGWTGYSLDSNLFPYPEDIFTWLREKGIHVSGNLHDADGVQSHETHFADMAKALNLDPNTTTMIPFMLNNKTAIYALEDIVLQPLDKLGFSFWWIDWQQGESGYGTKGGKMNPTIWTDKMRVTNSKRRHIQSGGNSSDPVDRGVVFARFGGLGNHRYQVGFSGDVANLSWKDLAYQPYFTATSSNLLYGFWSHDIEGPGDNPEMYVRWIQWGAFSGVMRAHDRGMSSGGCYNFPTKEGSCPIVEPWNVDRKYFEANRDVLQQRAALIPYIYTQVRIAHDSGISIIRPLYYDYPKDEMSYASDENGNFVEYMFGEDMLVAPVAVQSDQTTMSTITFYLPEGTWVEKHSGIVLTGGRTITHKYDLSEIPVFVKGGAVIPEKPVTKFIGNAMEPFSALIFSIFPGANSGSTQVYEDDALTTAYLNGEYSWTKFSYTRNQSVDRERIVCSVATTVNKPFTGQLTEREIIIKIVNSQLPQSININGKQLTFSRNPKAMNWFYDGNEMALLINAGVHAISDLVTITIDLNPTVIDVSGIKGIIRHAVLAKRNLDETHATAGSQSGNPTPAELSMLAIQGDVFTIVAKDATLFNAALANFTSRVNAAINELQSMVPPPENALTQLYSGPDRNDHLLCGSSDCISSNTDYKRDRFEGYQPSMSQPGAVKLYDYWNGKSDNWVTTNKATPDGYAPSWFDNGYVLSVAQGLRESDVVPLALYYHAGWDDHMTVATDAGKDYAKQNNYTLVNDTIGYVYAHQPLCKLGNTDALRLNYSIALINSATSFVTTQSSLSASRSQTAYGMGARIFPEISYVGDRNNRAEAIRESLRAGRQSRNTPRDIMAMTP